MHRYLVPKISLATLTKRYMSSAKQASTLRVAALQFCASDNTEENLLRCQSLIERAIEAGAKLCCLPECFHFIGGGETGLKSLDVAEPLSGPTISRYQEIAASNQVWLSLGGFQETDESTAEHVFNTHVIINPLGEVSHAYRKLHMFDYPRGGLMESSFTTAGSAADVGTVRINEFNVGPTTCYDLRFPSLYQLLRDMGANVMLVPSAFTLRTGMAHWHTLLRARAIENQAYVIAAAQGGIHNEKRESYGHSLIIDPWGNVISECGEVSASGGMAIADLDIDIVQSIRERMPVARHLRADVYGSTKDSYTASTVDTVDL